jgi:hypothetical protein
MKKIFIALLISVSFFTSIQYVSAAYVEVEVTEAVPGANCGAANSDGIITCQVQAGFGSVMELF